MMLYEECEIFLKISSPAVQVKGNSSLLESCLYHVATDARFLSRRSTTRQPLQNPRNGLSYKDNDEKISEITIFMKRAERCSHIIIIILLYGYKKKTKNET
jgi:hypothetical protein